METGNKNENVLETTENTEVVNGTETAEAVAVEPTEAPETPAAEVTETAEVAEATEATETAEVAAAETAPAVQPAEVAAPVVAPVAAEAMVFCSACGTQMSASQRFCPNCGANREANVGVNQAVEEFNKQLNETKKKKKKKKIKILALIVAIILVFNVGKGIFTSARHSIGISQAEKAVESYNEEKIDYDKAIEKVTKLKDSKDAEVASKALEAEETINALKDSKEHFEKGELYKGKSDYKNAVLHYEAVIEEDTKYEAAKAAIEEIIPLWKSSLPADIDALLKDGKKEDADKLIKTFLSYAEDDKEITNISKFLEAEELYADGYLNGAQDIYKTLPESLKVNGITVKSRIDTLNKYAMFVKMSGKWKTTSYYYETKETYKSTGRWQNWYSDGDSAERYLTVRCIINSDGTVSVKGSAPYMNYTNYSDYASNLKREVFTSDFNQKCKLTSDGKLTVKFTTGDITYSGYTLTDNNTLTFDGSKFTFNQTTSYNASHYYRYNWVVKVTYGTRTEKY